MTKLLERAIETMRGLSVAQQDEIARVILDLAHAGDHELDGEDTDPAALPGLLEGLADAEAGRFATEEEIEAAFRKFTK